jgi:hypothetical protein
MKPRIPQPVIERDPTVPRFALLLFFAFTLVAASPAAAFTFSDGTKTECIAAGRVVNEFYAPPEHEVAKLGRIGMTITTGKDYLIIWNAKKLDELPPAIHDLLFFHECAHAQVPTKEELKANCEGLKAMRAANRAGFAVESQLALFYDSIKSRAYWQATLKCANAAQQSSPK